MTLNQYLMLFLSTLGLLSPALAATPTTQRTPAVNGWNASAFDYARSDDLVVERTTPNAAQVNFKLRPPQKAEEPAALDTPPGAKPLTVGPVDVTRLRFKGAENEIVTALLCTPTGKTGPFPLVIAVHGLGSNKAQVVGQVAPALAKEGFAVLAPDMPLHGERPGRAHALWEKQDFVGAIRRHRQAVINVRQTIDVAEQLAEVDVSKGVIFAGYSMGAWIHSIAGPSDPRVRAMVLMVGGATELAHTRLIPALAAADPQLALPNFAPRPLLMLNAKRDSTVTPEMGKRLFAAAVEPKEQRWYDSGHLLPTKAYDDAARWVARTWAAVVASDN
ncbi:MAG: alpha/beta fold hydrolase [Planctomycetota bacterium]|nr:alpha/beta fold hydrolase [Planctomycetota bacterium]